MYTDNGYDQFLTRDIGQVFNSDTSSNASGGNSMLNSSQFDTYVDSVSGSKVQGGIMQSPDGKVKIDLDNAIFSISDGLQDLVRLGTLDDGSIGLVLTDSQGNILMKVSAGEFYLQSPLKTSRLDLIADQFTIKDAAGLVRIFLGDDHKN